MQLEDFSNLKSRDYVFVRCYHCGKDTEKLVKDIRQAIRSGNNLYCGRICLANHQSKQRSNRIETTCYTCGVSIHVIPSEIKYRNYCSKSCAAKTNNKLHPKRVPQEVVEINGKQYNITKKSRQDNCECGNTKSRSSLTCRQCVLTVKRDIRDNKTLGDIRKYYTEIENKRLGSIAHTIATRVRRHARLLAEEQDKPKVCKICGYSIYVELCHIKPISEFPDEATLLEINGADNTVYLCPNHHKEFDLGLVSRFDLCYS